MNADDFVVGGKGKLVDISKDKSLPLQNDALNVEVAWAMGLIGSDVQLTDGIR